MKHYTETIPVTLAEKLKEKGMPLEMQPLYTPEAPNARGIVKAGVGLWCPPYAEVFDWLMERGRNIFIIPSAGNNVWKWTFNASVCEIGPWYYTWHEAANAAIEKALTLI